VDPQPAEVVAVREEPGINGQPASLRVGVKALIAPAITSATRPATSG
jgi:hypothetical protein